LADFYERDLRKLIEEVNLFTDEENLWKVEGSVKNSSGNLVLHIIGGTNYLIGTQLANTGYVRNRDEEFIAKGIPRRDLIIQLEALIPMIAQTLKGHSDAQLEEDYPLVFDGAKRPKSYIIIQLLAHLNYHLGQVNYLRRIVEKIV
jgi:hypothetical protein